MKKILLSLFIIFILIGCSNAPEKDSTPEKRYTTGGLILETIIASSLMNNYGLDIGEGFMKTRSISNSNTVSSTNIDNSGNINTHSVTETTTKSRSKGIFYGIGF